MFYAVTFLLLAAVLAVNAAIDGGWRWWLMWPAVSFALVGAAYLGLGPRVFGKRADGTVAAWAIVLLLPYLLLTWCVWHLARRRRPAYHELTQQIVIGQRLFPAEFPEEIDVVVDLTCEFTEPRVIREGRRYIGRPTLDNHALSPEALAELATDLARTSDRMYIHCAAGHGRTGMVAVAVLLARGEAHSVDEALAAIKAVRPRVRLNACQRAAVEAALPLMRGE